jgi:hypothetical protein
MRTKIDDDTTTVRVGRWMDQDEYDKMVATGRVQAGSQGDATSAMLDGPGGFANQAPSGRIYVEFDIPANSPWWVTDSTNGWITIPAPNSSQANKWQFVTGTTITEMPPATDITEALITKD